MDRTVLYKLCGVLLAIWSIGTIAAKTPVLHQIESALYRAEQKWIGTRILAGCRGWHVSESQYARIYYTEPDGAYIPLMLRTLDMYMPLLAGNFGVEKDMKAGIVVYADEGLFRNAIGGGGQKLPMGAYHGGLLNILSPRLWIPPGGGEADAKDIFITSGPMLHELTHYMMDVKTGGNCDTWFNEGVALYYEYKYTGYEWREDLRGQGDRLRLDDLQQNFRRIDEGLAYRRAFDIVNSIVEKQGEDGLQTIIHGLSTGKRLITCLG